MKFTYHNNTNNILGSSKVRDKSVVGTYNISNYLVSVIF